MPAAIDDYLHVIVAFTFSNNDLFMTNNNQGSISFVLSLSILILAKVIQISLIVSFEMHRKMMSTFAKHSLNAGTDHFCFQAPDLLLQFVKTILDAVVTLLVSVM